MPRKFKVCRNWLSCPSSASDARSEARSEDRSEVSEIFVQGILCLAHVLHFTLPAFNQKDYVLSLAVGRCAHWVGLAGSSAFETVSDLHVFTSLTVSSVAWSVPTCDDRDSSLL